MLLKGTTLFWKLDSNISQDEPGLTVSRNIVLTWIRRMLHIFDFYALTFQHYPNASYSLQTTILQAYAAPHYYASCFCPLNFFNVEISLTHLDYIKAPLLAISVPKTPCPTRFKSFLILHLSPNLPLLADFLLFYSLFNIYFLSTDSPCISFFVAIFKSIFVTYY